jgi:hypothetical protein
MSKSIMMIHSNFVYTVMYATAKDVLVVIIVLVGFLVSIYQL